MKKVNKARRAPKFSAARLASLAPVRHAAFNSGVARSQVIAAVFAACGKKPILSLYNAAKLELQIGFMGAALARKGDNREPSLLMDHCREKLTLYQGHGGSAKLKAGMKGRRTADEEVAYGSARVLVSSVFKDAGVKVPESRGGDTSKTRTPGGKTKAKAEAKPTTKPAVPRFKSAERLGEYFASQSVAMLAVANRNASLPGVQKYLAALQAFSTEITKLNG